MGAQQSNRTGRQLYVAAIGAAVGALVMGVLLPFLHESAGEETAAGSTAAVGAIADGPGLTDERPLDDPTTGTGSGVDEASAGTGLTATPGGGTSTAASGGAGRARTSRPPVGSGGGEQTAPGGGQPGGELRIGVLVADTGAVSRLGLSTTTPEQNEAWWRDSFAVQNAAGGAGGHELVPVVEQFDALDSSRGDHLRACEALANDGKVFAVIAQSGYSGHPVLCLTERYGIPTLLIEGESSEYYERSKGLLFSKNAATERAARNTASLTHRRGILRDRTIGIVVTDVPSDARAHSHGLAPRLDELGYDVAVVSRLSQDLSTTQSQIPVEIARQRAAGVDLVFLVTDPVRVILWTREADAQGFLPRYVAFDLQSATSDFTVENAPESFDAVGVTVTQQGWDQVGPEPEPERACREALQAHGGEPVPEGGTAGYRNATVYCGMVRLLARAIEAAGPEPTPASLVGGFESLGPFAAPDVGPASFGPGKHDGADAVRLLRADMEQRRWVPQGPFEQPG